MFPGAPGPKDRRSHRAYWVQQDLPAQQTPALRSEQQRNSLSLSGPRRAGPMSAAHSGQFARTELTKTGFAAAGPEHERSECEVGLIVPVRVP
jgi:hypothetical protein